MKFDKKVKNGKMKFVLIKKIGVPVQFSGGCKIVIYLFKMN